MATNEPSDWDLLEAFYDENDTDALSELAARYNEFLAGLLKWLVDDPDVAESLVNDVWLAVQISRGKDKKGNDRPRLNPKRGTVKAYLRALAAEQARRWLCGK